MENRETYESIKEKAKNAERWSNSYLIERNKELDRINEKHRELLKSLYTNKLNWSK